jgi:hypothetical protein
VLSHRKGIEEAEARASEMDDARADAQRFLERSGAHALAAAGCMGATLLRLELIDTTAAGGDLRSMPENKLEGAYKRALAKNHPDRSAARGDDVAAAARCEETFKLLQAAHLRWTEMGKPVGDAADVRARAAYPLRAHTSSAAASSTRAGARHRQRLRERLAGGSTRRAGRRRRRRRRPRRRPRRRRLRTAEGAPGGRASP